MANVIKLRKGLNVNLKGKAQERLESVETKLYALVPDDFTGVTPKIVVKDGMAVKAGDALFQDKAHPQVKFVSPVSGTVKAVERGERRKVLALVVEADGSDEYVDFGKSDPSSLSKEQVLEKVCLSGLFAFVRQRPYDIIANPEDSPRAIFVSAFSSAPLAPSADFMLKGNEAAFQAGLTALSRIAPTYLSIHNNLSSDAFKNAKDVKTYVFDGPHPAGNVGVQIGNIAPVNKGETVWTLSLEPVIFIGRLFLEGKVDLTKTVALVGSEVKDPHYLKLKMGASLELLNGRCNEDRPLRYISGDPLTGKKVTPADYLGAFSSQITVLPEGSDNDELLGWIMPRFNEFSTSRSYFSWLCPKKEYALDCRIKGGERHMIMSGEYDSVLPMDIFPEQLLKAVIAGDIDRMEALGIYEIAPEDVALCEFVCSSKVPLQRILREGLDALRKEMA